MWPELTPPSHPTAFAYIIRPFKQRHYAQVFTMTTLAVGGAIIMWTCLVQLATQRYCPRGQFSMATFFRPNLWECFTQSN